MDCKLCGLPAAPNLEEDGNAFCCIGCRGVYQHFGHIILSDSATEALTRVLADAGTTKPHRDAVDVRVIEEVRAGTGKTRRTPAETGGWPKLAPGTPLADQDRDGMPDTWEKTHGLNPSDSGDSRLDRDKDGYTNLEEYLNGTDPTVYIDYTVTSDGPAISHNG